ncbi:hypothetical protein CsSME_00028104 [Camellia sinensis var. sinensis]
MEQQLRAKFEQILNQPITASTSLQALSLARSLLNPSTSDSTISSPNPISLSVPNQTATLSLFATHTLSLSSPISLPTTATSLTPSSTLFARSLSSTIPPQLAPSPKS